MKFVHLADLHLGKRECGFSMLEDQRIILDRIYEIIQEESPDAVLIAGDVYDKLTPPAEAVTLLDDFLSRLADQKTEVFIIAGNHDSAERVAFGSRIMDRSGIHFSPVYNGKTAKFTMTDEYGEVDIHLMPYLRYEEVRRFFKDEEITNTEQAAAVVVREMDIDESKRNVVVSHQFAAGGLTSDSERNSVGGTDMVSAEIYAPFDYTALGHLHKPQYMGGNNIRYSGTPLKYSMSEANDKKSVTIVEMGKKGEPLKITLREPEPLRDMRQLHGSIDELIEGESNDYVSIVLTDTTRVPDAQTKLRAKYPYLMGMKYEHEMERSEHIINISPDVDTKNPLELFEEFFKSANGKEMTEKQSGYMQELINGIWG